MEQRFDTCTDARRERVDVELIGKALLVLAAGGLLGLMVALPYDRLLGLPDSTGTFLGAAVWFVLLGAFQVGGARDAVVCEDGLARRSVADVQARASCGILAFDVSGLRGQEVEGGQDPARGRRIGDHG